MNDFKLETERLRVVKGEATDEDINFFFNLYTNPEVMKFVGFPNGLNITKEEIKNKILKQDISEFDQALIVTSKIGDKLGECKLGRPDKNGISVTDIKLFRSTGIKVMVKKLKPPLLNIYLKIPAASG